MLLAFGVYSDLAQASYEMMMTFKSVPLTAENRAKVVIQRQYENTAQVAYVKARTASAGRTGHASVKCEANRSCVWPIFPECSGYWEANWLA